MKITKLLVLIFSMLCIFACTEESEPEFCMEELEVTGTVRLIDSTALRISTNLKGMDPLAFKLYTFSAKHRLALNDQPLEYSDIFKQHDLIFEIPLSELSALSVENVNDLRITLEVRYADMEFIFCDDNDTDPSIGRIARAVFE